MNTPEYSNLIYQAYIKPIRSVVMIDDQFPTYNELLERENDASHIPVSESAKEYLRILCNLCRDKHWTYHVENGILLSDTSIPYNADLIFLDFKLGKEDNGEKAIDTIELYSHSDQFNFIVVYTEETVSKAFYTIVASLGHQDLSIDKTEQEELEDLFAEHSDLSQIITTIAQENYCMFLLEHRKGKENIIDKITNIFKIKEIPCDKRVYTVFKWAITKVADNYFKRTTPIKQMAGSINDRCNWLQIDHLFLTVINKQENFSSSDLFERIISAFDAWNPSPGQIILKDAKNQIDNFCLFDLFKSEKHELAWFYFTYVSPKKFMQENDILYNLVDLVKDQLTNSFHKELIDIAKGKEIHDFYPSCTKTHKSELYHNINIFNSTFNPRKITHFSMGMVFRDTESGNYWICSTQSCDLIPTQNSLKWILGNFRPITFTKLYNQNKLKALSCATRCNSIFFEDENVKKCFCICEEKNGFYSNPHYEVFFAPNKGIIASPQKISIYQVGNDDPEKLKIEERTFSFVTQLLQEYAFMLLQKISNHRSRTPVNYINT